MTTEDQHGPHGGPLVKTNAGFVELSVYETGVPPHFRLYVFDSEMKPRGLPSDADLTVETVRPKGARQTFTFIPRTVFLQSTADIPEPHEFDVAVNVSRNGQTQVYRSKFTEEGHDHGASGHGHSHGPGGHSHGTGLLGWFRGKFAHSHSVVDKVDE